METLNRKNLNGYVLYAKNGRRNCAVGIISEQGIRKAVVRIENIPTFLRNALVLVEDVRFYRHFGIDIRAFMRACFVNIRNLKISQGASTITQQLARNLFYSNQKSVSRKIKELILALKLERVHTKKEILELYFNNVFWGRNLYGIRSASLSYFSKEPCELSKHEQTILLSLLRGPNFYLRSENALQSRFDLLNKKIFENGLSTLNQFKKIARPKRQIKDDNFFLFREASVPFLSTHINDKQCVVYTGLDKKLQGYLSAAIKKQKISLSVLIIKNGVVRAVSGTHGNDYAFSYKCNVGSTLKPFLYTILRKHGISSEELISTVNQEKINWKIREATFIQSKSLKLREALKVSNNNVFVNASFKIGINIVYQELQKLIPPQPYLTPSIILGASEKGISLYELTSLYNSYFKNCDSELKLECRDILGVNLFERTNLSIDGGYLKTGTTNNYNQRFAIFGSNDLSIGFLTEGFRSIEEEDYIKDEDYIIVIKNYITEILNRI